MEKKELPQMHNLISYSKATSVLTRAEKVGQLFMPAAFINDTETEILILENLIRDHAIGGLCFFHSRASAATNYEGRKKVVNNENSFNTLKALIERYQRASKYPLLISIDAEWGLAMRIENTPQYPYAICLGAIQDNDDLIYQMGQQIGRDCLNAGIHWNLAPVTDINNNPENPVIGYRSFGEDKHSVTLKALAFMRGMQEQGLLTSAKHFPGHGDTAIDSHLSLPLIDKSKQELLENELYPFQKLIEGGIDAIMAGHLSVPALANGSTTSSSLSSTMLKDLLRNEMGFDGVVISDALNMRAVSKNYPSKGELEWLAFEAGNDILCFAENTEEGIQRILVGSSAENIEEHFYRVWKLKEKALTTEPIKTKGLANPRVLNQKLALKSLSLYMGTSDEIKRFNKNGFTGVEISRNSNTFFKHLQSELSFDVYSTSKNTLEEIEKELKESENILLALFPPKAKPFNNFEISKNELAFINSLILEKNVVLYLFGNPYVLNLIDTEKAKAVVIAYQDFEAFQINAASHFTGKVKAYGKLPVTIGKYRS